MEEYKKVWQELLNEISNKISTVSYDMWFTKLEPLNISFGKLILVAPMKSIKETLNKEDYKIVITNAIKYINNPCISDYVIITPDEKESYEKTENKKKEENKPLNTNMFNENFTFDNFIVGSSNNIARAAAFAVAQNPGNVYNPLFIYGGVGLGKTHILHAIGNYIIDHNPDKKIIYVTTEQFVNDFIDSISNNKNNDQNFKFREKYRNVDVLMLDDIQFLAGKLTSQEAVFHTFNDLYQFKKQIIITSDRHPKELSFLEERLQSRFQSGLTVDISTPDLETRIAILQKKAFQKNFNISKSIIYFIAEKITSNIREIEGALSKVIFYCQLNNKDCADDLNLVIEALKDDIDVSSHVLSIDSIVDAVCSYYNITKAEIKGTKRSKNIVIPRQVAMYLISDLLSVPLLTVGNYFGGKDHTTIMYARDKITDLLKNDNLLKMQVKDIKNIIQKN